MRISEKIKVHKTFRRVCLRNHGEKLEPAQPSLRKQGRKEGEPVAAKQKQKALQGRKEARKGSFSCGYEIASAKGYKLFITKKESKKT